MTRSATPVPPIHDAILRCGKDRIHEFPDNEEGHRVMDALSSDIADTGNRVIGCRHRFLSLGHCC